MINPIESNTVNVGINIKWIEPIVLVKWSQNFIGRTYTRKTNGYPVLVIEDVSFHEFICLVQDCSLGFGPSGKVHVFYRNGEIDPLRFTLPHEDVYITNNDSDLKK